MQTDFWRLKVMLMTEKTRSPLKAKPLRNPGQSVEEKRRKLVEDKFQEPALMAAFLITLAILEWWRSYSRFPPSPIFFSGIAAIALAFAMWRLHRIRPEIRALRQAAEGEKAVGQFLESLRESGNQVFHDLLGNGFNVDHVVVGKAGVFTIETKTWSKPAKGEARITFDGERIQIGQRELDRNPVIQAKAQAGWLREILQASTGRNFSVQPVIVFPGWFIERTPNADRRVWVLNPKALPSFLETNGQKLSEEDVKLASFHLSRFIRAEEAGSVAPD